MTWHLTHGVYMNTHSFIFSLYLICVKDFLIHVISPQCRFYYFVIYHKITSLIKTYAKNKRYIIHKMYA